MQHYISFYSQGLNDRPWSEAFAGPILIVSAAADPQTATIKGGGWGFLCPLLEEVNSGKILEYCLEEWRVGHGDPGNSSFDVISECSNTPNHIFDQVLTEFANGTRFATEVAGSANTFAFESNPGTRSYIAGITPGNLDAAIEADNKPQGGGGCGAGLSTNVSQYALIGVEDGMEGYGLTEFGGHKENLQLRTKFGHYQIPSSVATWNRPA
jgi:hypothetical protein